MPSVELSAGTIEYADTGGAGPILLFVHGLTMDGTVWRKVVSGLGDGYRCITPTWPLGSQRIPMKPDADLTLPGVARLIGEFCEALGLEDVTVVQTDWGGVQVLLAVGAAKLTKRIGRLVLTSCEAFDNYPPGIPGKILAITTAPPGGIFVTMQLMRTRLLRRGPTAWGWMSKRPVPKEVMDAWFTPATHDRGVRRDLKKYVSSVPDNKTLMEWANANAAFTGPVLIVWGTEDKVMPPAHGRRLAELYPDSTLVELDDTFVLIPEDRPEALVDAIREFLPA
jgi:pimeloyl-ACP methyl ester carboxylesterase